MSRYRVSGSRPVHGTEPGELLDTPLDDQEESDLLASGRVELVPCLYTVVGPHEVFGASHGESFEAALTAGQERSLVDAGHIELVGDVSDLEQLSRKALNAMAAEAGVEDPDKLSNKGAVIDAIEATKVDTPDDDGKE